jgi:hypothetical protein
MMPCLCIHIANREFRAWPTVQYEKYGVVQEIMPDVTSATVDTGTLPGASTVYHPTYPAVIWWSYYFPDKNKNPVGKMVEIEYRD